MKNKPLMIISAIATILIAADLFSQSGGPGMGHRRGHGPMHHGDGGPFYGNLEMMKEKLDLSDKQIEMIGRINNEFRETMAQLKEKMEPLQLKLRELLLSDTIDENELRPLLKKISDIEIDMRIARIRHRIAIEKILTKEQRERLRTERKGMMRNWRER